MLKLSVNYFAKPGRQEEFLRRIVESGILTAIRERTAACGTTTTSPARMRTKFCLLRSGRAVSSSASTWSRNT